MQAKNGECKPLGVCDTCDPSAGVSFFAETSLGGHCKDLVLGRKWF